jgi:hypothetical protein
LFWDFETLFFLSKDCYKATVTSKMTTFLDTQVAQLHQFIDDISIPKQAILHVFDDVRVAIRTVRSQRARDSLAHSYAISLCYVLLPKQAASIAKQLTEEESAIQILIIPFPSRSR